MEIEGVAGFTALFLMLVLTVTVNLKIYYHFKFFQKVNNLDISFMEFWLNPLSYFFTKMMVYYPFVLRKAVPVEDEELYRYRNYIVRLSWTNLIGFVAILSILAMKN